MRHQSASQQKVLRLLKVTFSPRALRHLDDLHYYISTQSYESRADAYISRIDHYCMGLADFPERGTRRDDILLGLRMIGFERNATIAFSVREDEVIIEGVLYGGRSADAVLVENP